MTNGNVDHGLEGQLRQACAELDCGLRAGKPYAAEFFFTQFPLLAASADGAVELIYTELVTLEALGRAPAPEEYYRRFPHWRAQLQEQFQIHALISATNGQEAPTPAKEPSVLPASDWAGGSIGSYELLAETARGAMGVVYKARHRVLNRTVALKMILAGAHASRDELLRFRTEAEAVARLQHPHIVQIYEVGDSAGRAFLALEFVAGGSLAQKLDGKPQPPAVAAGLVANLARAIHYAHEQGILHRDLKPANILLQIADCRVQSENPASSSGDKSAICNLQSAIPKITDFGLAKLLDRNGAHSETGALCGTLGYMAPEQAACRASDIGPAVDTYALGAILYELLTGRPPFKAESLLQTLNHVVYHDPVPPQRLCRGLPRDLALICIKCLQKEPQRRYASAALLADDLERFRAGEPIEARPIRNSERFWKWIKRRPAVFCLLLLLMLSAGTLFGGNLWYTTRLRRATAEADYEREQVRVAARDAERQRSDTEIAVREARRGLSQARAASHEAQRQKTEATRQIELARSQSDYSRRLLFTMQLTQVGGIWKSDPASARRLLMDEERCPRDLRDFAWGMYRRLCDEDRLLPSGCSHGVRTLAISPDGKLLAITGMEESTVRLWDLGQRREHVALKGHSGRINALAFASDGRLLATAGEDRTVRLWFTDTGKKYVTLRGHQDAVTSVAFARNGKSLASGSIDRSARQWDVATGKELLALQGHTSAVRSVAFAPDSETLATGSDDRTVRFWDLLTLASDKERNVLKLDEQGAITCIAFSPDGKKLAIAGARRAAVDLFDMESYSLKTSLRGHVDRVYAVSFSPDGKMLGSAGEDRTVRLWDVDSGAERLALQGHAGAVRSVAFAADNQTLASAGNDNDVRLWAIGVRADFQRNNQDLVRSWNGHLITMAYSPDGKILATGDHDGVLKLSDARTQKLFATLPGHGGSIWSITFSADSKTIATCAEDGKVKLWDVIARRKLVTLVGPGQPVRAVTFSPDGKLLASGGADGRVKLWDVATRRQHGMLSNHKSEIFALGFSPNGETLAVGGQEGHVRLFDVRTLSERSTLARHQRTVLFTVFSPDGKTLATGGLDNAVHLWDTRTLTPRATLLWHAGYVFSAAFAADGRSLATGGGSRAGSHLPGEVKIWDVSTGHCHATLSGQTGPVAFSPSGNDLATANNYIGVRTWHATID